MNYFTLAILFLFLPGFLPAQNNGIGEPAPKPLYRDPVYDGAADPVIVWNPKARKWWMFYTNRRASDSFATGVAWVHGTRIGIAESANGIVWTYKDTACINYHPTAGYTYWAPEVVEDKGMYHMYLTYVPGVFADWNHPRTIIHLTSTDLLNWKYISTLNLANNSVIDPCVHQLPDGTWRLWYNNEPDHKSIYYADSPDLTNWTDKGKTIGDMPGEGPFAFQWKGKDWLIVDNWKGLGVYRSDNWLNWKRQDLRLVEPPGTGKDDQFQGGHAGVVVNKGRAYLFYFTHPGRAEPNPAPDTSFEWRRSVIQVTELHYKDGLITCDRNEPVYMDLENDSIDLDGKHLFLYTYFNDEGKGTFYALSNDGISWTELNHGNPIIKPQVGAQKLMRDPSIFKGIDGTYHLVWTTGWNGKDIGYASSHDLIHWSKERAIPLGKDLKQIEHCWAPEVFYNNLDKNYMIFWSSNYGPARLPNGEGRIYYVTTRDFNVFSSPKILFSNGSTTGGEAGNNGSIDAFILKDGTQKYILFYKKDDNTGVPTIYHRIGKSPVGPWGQEVGPIKPSTGDEGPSCIKIDGKYHVFTDPFESGYMYDFISSDLKTWERKVTNLKMSHGTILEISKKEAQKLLAQFNQ